MPLLDELRTQGYTATLTSEGKIKLRGPCRPSPELEKRIRECRDELIAALAREVVTSESEVYGLVRRYFDTPPFDPEEHPLPPAQKGRDPLARRSGEKVLFYQKGEAWRSLPPHLPPSPTPAPKYNPMYRDGEERDEPAETGATRSSYVVMYPEAERATGKSTPDILFTAESDTEAMRRFRKIRAAQTDEKRANKMWLERLDVRGDVRIAG